MTERIRASAIARPDGVAVLVGRDALQTFDRVLDGGQVGLEAFDQLGLGIGHRTEATGAATGHR